MLQFVETFFLFCMWMSTLLEMFISRSIENSQFKYS